MLATSSLQMLTSYRVGTCPVTIRPCPEKPRCGCGWNPHIRNGQWVNDCACRTRCAPLSEIDIPGPVGYIESLVIDGVAQDLWNGDWRLDDGHLLVWQGDGPSPVPVTQNLDRPDTEPGTWSITYSQSYPVGPDARLAVALLAMEFAKACQPKGKCALPKGVTNVVRNGVSFSVEAGLFPGGLTGIEITDQFILKWAPAGSPVRNAVVFDPRKIKPRVSSALKRRVSGNSATSNTNLVIKQGADWSHGWRVRFNAVPIDATWTARSQIRPFVESPVVLHEFAASVNADGSVVIAVTPAESSAWTWTMGVYDVEVVNADASVTLPVAEGSVYVDREVTR